MKVAVVYPIQFGASGRFGGGERYALELARALAEHVDTRLVTVGDTRTTRCAGRLRIEVHPSRVLLHGSVANPLAVGALRSLVTADVVHCAMYSTVLTDMSVLLARLCGQRVLLTDVGGGGWITLARVTNVARLSHGVLLLSRYANRLFAPGKPRRWVVYGGVDTQRFSPDGARRERRVLYVGRILSHKGIDCLIEAVPPDVPLTIVGRPYQPEYLMLLQRLAEGRNVTFVTAADDARIVEEYRHAAVTVLPSVYHDTYGGYAPTTELFGLTAVEAMSCGSPVVCSDVGSLPEVVQDGVTGFVVPPGDRTALRDRIMHVLDHPATAGAMGEAARTRVLERFTWDRVARSCLEAYAGRGADPQLMESAA